MKTQVKELISKNDLAGAVVLLAERVTELEARPAAGPSVSDAPAKPKAKAKPAK